MYSEFRMLIAYEGSPKGFNLNSHRWNLWYVITPQPNSEGVQQ